MADKSLVEILEYAGIGKPAKALASTEPPKRSEPTRTATPEEAFKEKAAKLTAEERRAQVYALKMQGVPQTVIANMFSVTPATINKWLQEHTNEYREMLEQQSAANLLAANIQFYDSLIQMGLWEFDNLSRGDSTVDPATGKVSRSNNPKIEQVRVKYLQSVIRAQEMKTDLLVKTGIIPDEITRMYKRLIDEKSSLEEKPLTTSERTKDDIKNNMLELITKGRHL